MVMLFLFRDRFLRCFFKINETAIDNVKFVDQISGNWLHWKSSFSNLCSWPTNYRTQQRFGKNDLNITFYRFKQFVEKKKVKIKHCSVFRRFFIFYTKFYLQPGSHHIDICIKQMTYFAVFGEVFITSLSFYYFFVWLLLRTFFTKCPSPLEKQWYWYCFISRWRY